MIADTGDPLGLLVSHAHALPALLRLGPGLLARPHLVLGDSQQTVDEGSWAGLALEKDLTFLPPGDSLKLYDFVHFLFVGNIQLLGSHLPVHVQIFLLPEDLPSGASILGHWLSLGVSPKS